MPKSESVKLVYIGDSPCLCYAAELDTTNLSLDITWGFSSTYRPHSAAFNCLSILKNLLLQCEAFLVSKAPKLPNNDASKYIAPVQMDNKSWFLIRLPLRFLSRTKPLFSYMYLRSTVAIRTLETANIASR
jgi:hypothetical protein